MTDYEDEEGRSERERPRRKNMGKNARYTRIFQRVNRAAKKHMRQLTKRIIKSQMEEEE